MYVRPEDTIRLHLADLLDEACRGRLGARLARAQRLRTRSLVAASRAKRAADLIS